MKVFIEDVIVDGEVKGKIYIESDSMGFQVTKRTPTVDKHGKAGESCSNLAYFSTIAGCVGFLLKMKIRESTASNLAELLEDVKRIEAYIQSKITV